MNYGNYFDATNPANVRMQVAWFVKCDWQRALFCGTIALAAIALSFYQLAAGIVILVAVVFTFGRGIWRAMRVFEEGEVCAARVIDADRNLIAVFTDLSKSSRPCPVIKIIRQPLGRVAGGPIGNGARLGYAAIPNGFPGRSRWEGFGGYLVNSGTTSSNTIQRVVSSISPQDWQMLESGIACLSKPYRKGLFANLDFHTVPVRPRIISPATSSTQRDDEAIRVACTNCGARLRLRNPYAVGRRIECPKCRRPFVASKPEEAGFWEEDAGDSAADSPPMLRRTARTPRRTNSRWTLHSRTAGIAYLVLALLLVAGRVWLRLEANADRLTPKNPAAEPAQAANPAPANNAAPAGNQAVAGNPAPAPANPAPAGNPAAGADPAPNQLAAANPQPQNVPGIPDNPPFPNAAAQVPNPLPQHPNLGVPRIAIAIPDANDPFGGRNAFGPAAGWPNPRARRRRLAGPNVGVAGGAWAVPGGQIVPRALGRGPGIQTTGDVVMRFVERFGKDKVLFLDIPDRRLSPPERRAVIVAIEAILGGHVESMPQLAGQIPNTTLVFHTDRDVKQVASAVTFAKVRRIDPDNRRIVLDASSLKISSKATEMSEPTDSPFKSPFNGDRRDEDRSPPKEESPFKVEK